MKSILTFNLDFSSGGIGLATKLFFISGVLTLLMILIGEWLVFVKEDELFKLGITGLSVSFDFFFL